MAATAGTPGTPGTAPPGEPDDADDLRPVTPAEEHAEERATSEKVHVDANTLLVESFRLAVDIYEDGFVPDFLIALWRGGTPVGVAVHEYFRWKGHDPYHTAIKTQSYRGLQRDGNVEIKGIEHVIDVVNHDDRMLVVDDVFDTGHTMEAVLGTIRAKARRNTPGIRTATVYYKPTKREVDFEPDYCRREVDAWIVFPHELEGLTEGEVREKGLDIHDLVSGK